MGDWKSTGIPRLCLDLITTLAPFGGSLFLRRKQKTGEQEPTMLIIGCDFHSSFQQIAIFDNQTGEIQEKKLLHPAEAAEFYRGLSGPVRVGIEAGAPCQWFRQLLTKCR